MMKIALIGHGKMGRLVETLAPEFDAEVVAVFDEDNNADCHGITRESLNGAEVGIEFTTPHTVVANIRACAPLGVNLVVGTTGWLSQMREVEEVVKKHPVGLIWSPNFSIGINVFQRALQEAARALAGRAEYGAWAYEIHHSAKLDAPSGTLLRLVEVMAEAGYDREVSIASNRAGSVPGTHIVGFDSAADTIELKHQARTREGFARGALTAAQWVRGRSGIHEFSDILFS